MTNERAKSELEQLYMSLSADGEYISRQAVNVLVDELARAISDERCCVSRGRSTATIMQDILDLPSVKQEPKYCDRNICFRNEYNNIGCDECEVTKSQEPSEDAISRQTVMDALCNDCELFKNGEQTCFSKCEEYHFLATLPSVNPQPKTGHWEWVQYDSNPNIGNWHCSECRTIIPHMPEEIDNTPIYKWCPICGARMECKQNG